jgi:GT2 family glycosyltransferase
MVSNRGSVPDRSATSNQTITTVPPTAANSPADHPFVSVLMPVRNEATFIEEMVSALLAQEYPAERVEVIVADGMSTDGTRDLLCALQRGHSRLIVIDNPDRIVSTGLNAALAVARGEIVIRIDGHALPAPDFIRENVAVLQEHPEAWIVGGPIRNSAATNFGKAVAIAMSHPLGVGNAFHRYPDYEGYSDSTAFPAFRRWVFDRIGTFDERLVRNQDDEFNYRVTQAGGKIYISPRVRYSYFVRERMGQLFRQYFQYGFWRIPVMQKHRRPTTVRQLAPTLFYVVCVVLALGGLWWKQPAVAVGAPLSYLVALLATGGASVPKHGMRVAARVPSAIATMHAGYAWGIGYGLWARLFRPTAWDIKGQMAAISR